MAQSLRTLKGVGEKTEKLFQKVGIYDTDDLLHYYPRNYGQDGSHQSESFEYRILYQGSGSDARKIPDNTAPGQK